MEDQNKRAGQSTRAMADRRYKAMLWFVLSLAGLILVSLILFSNAKALGLGGLGAVGLILAARLLAEYMDAKSSRMVKEERRAIRGAQAEEKVGTILDQLGEEYLVIHDLASPYGNIDHVVLGQHSGISLIETKAHEGRAAAVNGQLFVNGHPPEKDLLAQVLKNTYWLKERVRQETGLEVWITPS